MDNASQYLIEKQLRAFGVLKEDAEPEEVYDQCNRVYNMLPAPTEYVLTVFFEHDTGERKLVWRLKT